jgi:peptide/nickel transport system substrate-binding protein
VKNIVKGNAKPLYSACNPIQCGCDQSVVTKYEFNPQKAKALLTEAGYPNGFPLELWGARDKSVLEAITNYWNQVGVKTTLRYVKGPTVTKAYREGQAMAYYGSKGSFSIPDAGAVMTEMFAGESNEAFHGDKEVAELVVGTMNTLDPKVRAERFRKLVQRVSAQAYWVPTYVYSEEYMATADVAFEIWKDGMQRLFQIRWR